jgi:hypothetical protein
MLSTPFPNAFVYSAFPKSSLMSTGLQLGNKLVPWRPNPAMFTPTRGGGQEVASRRGRAVMMAIPAQPGAEVPMQRGAQFTCAARAARG